MAAVITEDPEAEVSEAVGSVDSGEEAAAEGERAEDFKRGY